MGSGKISTTHTYAEYAWNEMQRIRFLNTLAEKDRAEIFRIKSIAQLSARECTQLLLHPETRKQILLSGEPALTSAETH